jgi:alpha-galactosidase
MASRRSLRTSAWLLAALLPLLLQSPLGISAAEPLAGLVTFGDAYISTDGTGLGGTWTIGNARVALTLAVDTAGGFRIVGLQTPEDGVVWYLGDQPDSLVSVFGRVMPIGSATAGWRVAQVTAKEDREAVQLEFTAENAREQIAATRIYRLYPGAPVVETWTRLSNPVGGAAQRLENLNAWQLTIPARDVQWVTGLLTPDQAGGPFTLQRMSLAAGDSVELGAVKRSSESAVPWFTISRDGGQFFGGLMWSGSWSLQLEGTDTGVRTTFGLRNMATWMPAGQTVDTPHGFFGATARGLSASGALRGFVDRLRRGRPLPSLVTHNTWFVDSTNLTHDRVIAEIDRVSRLGAELFVLDAGWYAGAKSSGDFVSGWGTWQWDQTRFPEGLAVLAARARAQGMKFGLWVEPERVALETVGQSGLAAEGWLATSGGLYNPDGQPAGAGSAQICLAHPDAWKWIFNNLVRLIDATGPDYLKWDNNFWINCDRPGHGHTDADGNYAHVQALYNLLAALRERYPALLVENCSGGGTRVDFGMIRVTDSAWMDDRSSPAVRVRHNTQGLSALFPPEYLLSFVMNSADEQMQTTSDLPLSLRSRMAGMLGLSFDTGGFTEGQSNEIGSEVALYKRIRDLRKGSHAVLLTDQARLTGGPSWDVVETVNDAGEAVILGFQTDDRVDRVLVYPVDLQRRAVYEVRSADRGVLGYQTGAQLMNEGLTLERATRSAAQILTLTISQQ